MNCIVNLPRHRGEVQAGEGGVAEGQLSFLPWQCPLQDFSCYWKDIMNLIAMMCNKLILMKGNVIPRS